MRTENLRVSLPSAMGTIPARLPRQSRYSNRPGPSQVRARCQGYAACHDGG